MDDEVVSRALELGSRARRASPASVCGRRRVGWGRNTIRCERFTCLLMVYYLN